jgi:hypothetical protein
LEFASWARIRLVFELRDCKDLAFEINEADIRIRGISSILQARARNEGEIRNAETLRETACAQASIRTAPMMNFDPGMLLEFCNLFVRHKNIAMERVAKKMRGCALPIEITCTLKS